MPNGLDRRWSWRTCYWLCQLGGWSALGVFQLLTWLANVPGAPIGTALVQAFLGPAYGLAGTHVLHLLIRRRAWLARHGAALVVRVAPAILLWTAALDAARAATTYALMPSMGMPRRVLLTGFGTWVVLLVAWTALYLAVHEVRARRREEIRALRLEIAAREGQLQGLRSQLNPHFLFNALNSVRELTNEDPHRADVMLTQLSDLLRYALRANQHDLVALADEMKGVDRYLAVEAVRFEERLRIHWDIAAAALPARVPPLVLQTLVENAVKHGVARRPDGDDVTISAHARNGSVVIDVTNAGPLSPAGAAAGLGLRNARERLRLLFGDRAQLAVTDDPNGRVRARLTVPLAHAETHA